MKRPTPNLEILGRLRTLKSRGRRTGRDKVRSSTMSTRDLLAESVAGLFARPGRMLLTILGTVIGLAALVSTLGLSATAGNRIVQRFDELAATEILVTAKSVPEGSDPVSMPWDIEERLGRLNGIVAAGAVSPVELSGALVRTSPVSDPQSQTEFQLAVQAASPGLFEAVRADLATGRLPDEGQSSRGNRVAVLGPAAADRLGIDRVDQMPAVAIGDDLFLVIGILSDVQRQPDLLSSVIIPEGAARELYGLNTPGTVVIETELGAASLIAQQAPLAIRPDDPKVLTVAYPAEPERARDGVQGDLDSLFLLLGGVSLLVGAIGIANVTLVSVMERTGEIGLRRALGAKRRHIAQQFLIESMTMGLVGGIIGASVGTLVTVVVAWQQAWTPVLSPAIPLAAPVIGTTIGLVSGLYPSMRAARMEPVEALRSGT